MVGRDELAAQGYVIATAGTHAVRSRDGRVHVWIASHVVDRDGLGVELCDATAETVGEVFRNDRTGDRTVTLSTELPLDVLEWFLREARNEL